jgi:hypothetical protein
MKKNILEKILNTTITDVDYLYLKEDESEALDASDLKTVILINNAMCVIEDGELDEETQKLLNNIYDANIIFLKSIENKFDKRKRIVDKILKEN